MYYRLLYLQTLYILREHVNPIPLLQLHEEMENCVMLNLRILSSDTPAVPLVYIPCLCRDGFIQIIDCTQKDITHTIREMDRDDIYSMIEKVKEDPSNQPYVKLTDKLHRAQNFFGFSLSELILRQKGDNSLYVHPIFRQPDPLLASDIFVIMPFQNNFNDLYKDSIQKVCKHLNVTCRRADDIYSSGAIINDIWSLIYNSKVIIADCTGKNPNVMYELGIAHTLGKDVVLVTQNINDIPFDLHHLRHMPYEYAPHAIKQFEIDLEKSLKQYFK